MFATEHNICVDYKFEDLPLDVFGVELIYISLIDGCK